MRAAYRIVNPQHRARANADAPIQRATNSIQALCGHSHAYVGMVRRGPAGAHLRVRYW